MPAATGSSIRDERPALRRATGALQHRNFALFYAALLVSTLGGSMQGIANMWQIYELTGSPVHLGLTGLARAIPVIGLSLIGGVVADRVDRRYVMISTQVLSGLLAVGLGVLTATGLIVFWHIYVVTFLGSALMSMSAPARSAIIPNLVPREDLMNATALNSTTWQVGRIVGPAIAGALISAFGLTVAYVVNGLAHLVTVTGLALIYLGPVPGRPQESIARSLAEGLAFVRRRSIILVLLATDGAAMLFGSYQVVMPIFADRLGVGVVGYGFLQSAPGIGALVGAAAVMVMGDVRYKGVFVVAAILAYAVCLIALAASPWFLLSLVIAAGLGLTDSMQATPRNAVIQLVTPDEVRGRVWSFQHVIANGMPALGLTVMGTMAAVLTAPLALVVGAVACSAINLGILAARRDLRARELGAAPEEPARTTPAPVEVGYALTPPLSQLANRVRGQTDQ